MSPFFGLSSRFMVNLFHQSADQRCRNTVLVSPNGSVRVRTNAAFLLGAFLILEVNPSIQQDPTLFHYFIASFDAQDLRPVFAAEYDSRRGVPAVLWHRTISVRRLPRLDDAAAQPPHHFSGAFPDAREPSLTCASLSGGGGGGVCSRGRWTRGGGCTRRRSRASSARAPSTCAATSCTATPPSPSQSRPAPLRARPARVV